MIIRKSRIRSLQSYLAGVAEGESFTFGTRVSSEIQARLYEFGFSRIWIDGETLLPPCSAGPSCRKNAEGWEIVHRDQPKETAYRQFEWSWTEWHGPYGHVESRIIDQQYERYPRTHVPPPSIEIYTVSTPQGRMVVLGRTFLQGDEDLDYAKLGVNVLLELFSEAELLHENLTAIVPAKVRRVNWKVLPQGRHPWATLQLSVRDVLDAQGERKRPVFEHRWETISGYSPDFVAVGRAGFSGYLIFGFTDCSLYILESAHYGNATYVLDRDWEALSSLTKAELLDASLHQDRLIHTDNWDRRIRGLLRGARRAS
ncbi:MAG: hypothetical protein MPN21_00205 [Thermoanaerobaculia bacterium]|nr:hypothetical protein [Thermoanaerobaculia bacterium]